jgi:hypothetical protein
VARSRSRRQNPKALFFICLAFCIAWFAALMIVSTVLAGTANKSSYTQAHGLSRDGTVTSVHDYDGRDASTDLGVRLAEPVGGQPATTAHVRGISSLKADAAVRVLVDPQDPGYAELPGQPYTPKSSAQVAAAFSLVMIALFVFATAWSGRAWYRQRKRLDGEDETHVHDRDGLAIHLVEHPVAVEPQPPEPRAAERGAVTGAGIAREQRYRA